MPALFSSLFDELFLSLHNFRHRDRVISPGNNQTNSLYHKDTWRGFARSRRSDVSKGFRNKIHNPRCWYACRCKTVPFFPSFDSSSNFLRRIIKKRKSLRYLREDFFFPFFFPFLFLSEKKQGREKSDFLPHFGSSVSPAEALNNLDQWFSIFSQM